MGPRTASGTCINDYWGQFEIHCGSEVLGPVGNCGHVKEAHQSRQGRGKPINSKRRRLAVQRRIGKRKLPPRTSVKPLSGS